MFGVCLGVLPAAALDCIEDEGVQSFTNKPATQQQRQRQCNRGCLPMSGLLNWLRGPAKAGRSLRSSSRKLRSGRVLGAGPAEQGGGTPQPPRQGGLQSHPCSDEAAEYEEEAPRPAPGAPAQALLKRKLEDLPDDILALVLAPLEVAALVAARGVSRRFLGLASDQELWRARAQADFDSLGPLTPRAVELAGGWFDFYAQKAATRRRYAPWEKPSFAEVQAYLEQVTPPNTPDGSPEAVATSDASQTSDALSTVLFLLDGSGSMHDDDFTEMKAFMFQAVETFAHTGRAFKVGVVQFSTEARAEIEPAEMAPHAFRSAVDRIQRMNGGTNIAASLRMAGKIFKSEPEAIVSRSLLLLTDGRIDTYQTDEAVRIVSRLMDEMSSLSVYACGVGRGVTQTEMLRIIESATPHDKGGSDGAHITQAASSTSTGGSRDASPTPAPRPPPSALSQQRYLDLCVRADDLW